MNTNRKKNDDEFNKGDKDINKLEYQTKLKSLM